jgi:hypothetical protein
MIERGAIREFTLPHYIRILVRAANTTHHSPSGETEFLQHVTGVMTLAKNFSCFAGLGVVRDLRYRMNEALSLECEIASQLELQTVRRPFQARTGALIIDDEEVTVGPIDVT